MNCNNCNDCNSNDFSYGWEAPSGAPSKWEDALRKARRELLTPTFEICRVPNPCHEAPEYYRFDTIQVSDISGQLTSNAGQALQYLARSSRLDGKNKHESPLEDLGKARDFIDAEIRRVEKLEGK